MKHILTILFFLVANITKAQDFRLALKQEITEVSIIDINGTVEINGTSSNEVKITTVSGKETSSRKNAEADNTQHGINYRLEGNKLVLRGTLPEGSSVQYRIDIPERMNLSVRGEANFLKSIVIEKINGKIDITTNADVRIPDLSSGLVLQNNEGNTDIKILKRIDDPVSIISQSGKVALQIPQRMGVNLRLGSGTGKATARLRTDRGNTNFNGTQFSSDIFGGGTKIQVRSVRGDILVTNSK